MKSVFPRLWVLFTAGAFFLLWGLGALSPARAVPVWSRLLGIWGWGLVGLGFFGVALAAMMASRPPKRRILLRAACTPKKPQKLPRSIYTPPPSRRYHHYVARK